MSRDQSGVMICDPPAEAVLLAAPPPLPPAPDAELELVDAVAGDGAPFTPLQPSKQQTRLAQYLECFISL
jgi:hypothetical protein